jgi:PilZ domain-containing protein
MITDTSATLPQSPEQTSACSSAEPSTWSANRKPQAEKRREERYATCEYVEVCLLDMNNLRLSGMLRDISKHGMRIELDMPLKTGDRLEVLLQSKAIIFAEVRYCRRTGESYQVGSVIDDIYYPKTVVPSRASKAHASAIKAPVSEITSRRVTQHLRFGEKRPQDSPVQRGLDRTSKGVFDQVVSFRNPLTSERLGPHLDRNDIDNLLALRLSETKAALLERHLASCDECLDLLLRTLEERASSRAPSV